MDVDTFCGRYPRLFHLADARNWPSIQRWGLLSTSRLIERYASGCDEEIEAARRNASVRVPTGLAETPDVYIRDQHQINPPQLAGCLVGCSEWEYRQLLNRRVFFWTDPLRLERLHNYYRRQPQMLLIVDSRRLLEQHSGRTELTAINSGYVRRKPALRGPATFVPLAAWPDFRRPKVIEATVLDAVPDVLEFLISAEYRSGETIVEKSFKK